MIEINRKSAYTYRISPVDPLLIERRENKHGSRWYWYAHRDTPNEAKAALLQLDAQTNDFGV
jgi:hypothetical protein